MVIIGGFGDMWRRSAGEASLVIVAVPSVVILDGSTRSEKSEFQWYFRH